MIMKLGIELNIDVTKIDKSRIYEGKKGKYLKITTFVNPLEEDKYGNHGMVTHKKEDGEDRAPILGNAKVFWTDDAPKQPKSQPIIDDDDCPLF